MLVKLSTFNVPKVGRRATFESGRNSAKFWRHSAVSGLESCTPCLFILHVTTPVIWRGNRSVPKTHQITQDNAEIAGEWTLFIWLSIKWVFERNIAICSFYGTFSSISWIGRYNYLKIPWRHAILSPCGVAMMGRIYPFYFYFSLVRKMETCRSPAKYCFVLRVSCAYLCYVSGGILVEMRRFYQVDTEQTMAMKPMCLIGSLSKIYPFGAQ